MTHEWQVEHTRGRCAVSGRELREGEEFFTVLFEDGESFRRMDVCLEAWQGPPEGCFCHFRTRVPVKQRRKRLLVDDELLVNFFLRLSGESEPARLQFRFVLALILMRKRLLRYESSSAEDGADEWRMTLVKDHSDHRVVNPNLSDDQIEDVSKQLSAILHGDMGEWSEIAREASDSESDHAESVT